MPTKAERKVDLKDEEQFVVLHKQSKTIELELNDLKTKFRRLFEKGFTFNILEVRETPEGRFAPNWQDEAYALAKRFMKPVEIRKWEKTLHEKYPPTEVAPSFIVPKEEKKAV